MGSRLLVTGASGRVGTLIRPYLARPDRQVRLLDIAPLPTPESEGEEFVQASITDPDAMEAACKGVDLVVHLGGYPSEQAWADILDVNINGTYVVLDAARRQGVHRVLIASSTHAVGFVPAREAAVEHVISPRPDTLYGTSKAAAEALGSVFADCHGMSVVSARIGTLDPVPEAVRTLSTWLSPADAARLIEACAVWDEPGHRVVWGVSRNTRRYVSLAAGEAIGFSPCDDAEVYADTIPGAGPPATPAPEIRLGGVWGGPGFEMGRRW